MWAWLAVILLIMGVVGFSGGPTGLLMIGCVAAVPMLLRLVFKLIPSRAARKALWAIGVAASSLGLVFVGIKLLGSWGSYGAFDQIFMGIVVPVTFILMLAFALVFYGLLYVRIEKP